MHFLFHEFANCPLVRQLYGFNSLNTDKSRKLSSEAAIAAPCALRRSAGPALPCDKIRGKFTDIISIIPNDSSPAPPARILYEPNINFSLSSVPNPNFASGFTTQEQNCEMLFIVLDLAACESVAFSWALQEFFVSS